MASHAQGIHMVGLDDRSRRLLIAILGDIARELGIECSSCFHRSLYSPLLVAGCSSAVSVA